MTDAPQFEWFMRDYQNMVFTTALRKELFGDDRLRTQRNFRPAASQLCPPGTVHRRRFP
jgi:hypothetical protein